MDCKLRAKNCDRLHGLVQHFVLQKAAFHRQHLMAVCRVDAGGQFSTPANGKCGNHLIAVVVGLLHAPDGVHRAVFAHKSTHFFFLLFQLPVVQNVNSRKTSVVLGEAEKVLYGKGFILDTLCGKTYAISPRSFYQINHAQTEVLYGLAVEAAKLTGKEVVLDAYCGIGTIGLTASGRAKQVVGVELNRDAVQDAIGNARHNGVKNARFFAADATRWIREAAAAGEKADVIFMDPPREGSTPEFLASVARMAPKRVVYVSCNPVTLARDLATLTKLGYKAEGFTPVDMFPHTEHIETVCALSKTSAHRAR